MNSPHHSAHEASHQLWAYSDGAAVWGHDGNPIAPNIAPFATDMYAWLKRETSFVWQSGTHLAPGLDSQRNPYSESLTTLTASIATVIEDAVRFIESKSDISPTEAEVRRIRLECELVLYTARFSEAAIKQMLHCTGVPPKLYRNEAMGQLLAQDCRPCRQANLPRHSFSLLGSLAHHFFLCQEIDDCALDHLILANKRRNLEAAHSNAQRLRDFDPQQSRDALKVTLDEVGGAFAHLLGHVAKVEAAMIKEIELRIAHYPKMPPIEAYNYFLTRTVADYDSDGVYRGFGYGEERRKTRSESQARPS
ncbi:hypothetical protein [Pseudoxanthomonas sp. 10H]|uniref:hypothetical protein n=1 Tax=Pseudoxanthomonas sp. 10H TaxID=3242729 RepID=UPI003556A4A8